MKTVPVNHWITGSHRENATDALSQGKKRGVDHGQPGSPALAWIRVGPKRAGRSYRLAALALICCCAGCSLFGTSKTEDSDRSARRHSSSRSSSVSPTDSNHSTAATPTVRLTVNGDQVTADELWLGLGNALSEKAATLAPPAYRTFVEQRAAQMITDKIAEMLLLQRASLPISEEMSTRIDQYVEDEIRRIVTTEHDGIRRRYEKDLKSKGLTLDQARRRIRREIIVASFLETQLKPKMAEPTRDELLALFEATADSYHRPARHSMSLIDVRIQDRLEEGVNNPTRPQWEDARNKARSRIETARAEVNSAVPFAQVARRYSDGLHAKEGGVWGWVSPGSVRERFEPAIIALYTSEDGEVSDVIATDDAFFLVRCDKIDPGFEATFESVQPQLKDRHYRTEHNRLITELVLQLRSKAQIEPADLRLFHAAVIKAADRALNGERG